MRKWLALPRPSPWLARRLVVLVAIVAVGVGAFCIGRHGTASRADAVQSGGPVQLNPSSYPPGQTTTDYQRRPVAYIYDNIPISREELGEYLITRFGAERNEFLINRKIVEMACKGKGIYVSDAEVDAQLQLDIKSFGNNMREEDFVNQVLKRFNKTLFEWKEDVIRPKLLMTKLVRPEIRVEVGDVEKEFEARFGPRVHCRMIVLQKDNPHRDKIWQSVSKSEDAFREEARKQPIAELAARGGDIPPIHKHFPDEQIEKEAFSLKPGQVSALIQTKGDGTWVILKCEEHIPQDQTKRIEDVRIALSQEIIERKLQLQIPVRFQEMRNQANPKNLLVPANHTTQAISAPKLGGPATH